MIDGENVPDLCDWKTTMLRKMRGEKKLSIRPSSFFEN
jgi:hypothetical protein